MEKVGLIGKTWQILLSGTRSFMVKSPLDRNSVPNGKKDFVPNENNDFVPNRKNDFANFYHVATN